MKFLLILLLLIHLGAMSSSYAIEQNNLPTQEMVYRYWDWDITPERAAYQLDVLKLALEKTKDDWGGYRIIRQVEKYSGLRAQRAILEGKLLNLHAAPLHPVAPSNPLHKKITIEIPLMKSLLGYRQLIIRRSDYEKFRAIKDEAELKELVVGQGSDWADLEILRHNGYRATDSEYYNLISMLLAKRFDYLSMGVIETGGAMTQLRESDELMVLPKLLIYYPLPTFFHVSPAYPELAARLEQGMKRISEDGSLEALFYQHFARQIQKMRDENPRVFILENPAIDAAMGLNEPLLLKPQKQ